MTVADEVNSLQVVIPKDACKYKVREPGTLKELIKTQREDAHLQRSPASALPRECEALSELTSQS